MAAQTHAAFMSLLSNLIDGHQDAGAYEDACRALLGQQPVVVISILDVLSPRIGIVAHDSPPSEGSLWCLWHSSQGALLAAGVVLCQLEQ